MYLQALGNLYFIHEDIDNVLIWDFVGKQPSVLSVCLSVCKVPRVPLGPFKSLEIVYYMSVSCLLYVCVFRIATKRSLCKLGGSFSGPFKVRFSCYGQYLGTMCVLVCLSWSVFLGLSVCLGLSCLGLTFGY